MALNCHVEMKSSDEAVIKKFGLTLLLRFPKGSVSCSCHRYFSWGCHKHFYDPEEQPLLNKEVPLNAEFGKVWAT